MDPFPEKSFLSISTKIEKMETEVSCDYCMFDSHLLIAFTSCMHVRHRDICFAICHTCQAKVWLQAYDDDRRGGILDWCSNGRGRQATSGCTYWVGSCSVVVGFATRSVISY